MDGFQVGVALFAMEASEQTVLVLQLPLRNKRTGELVYLNLDNLTVNAQGTGYAEVITQRAGKDPVTGSPCFLGERTYGFSLSQINQYLANTGLGVQLKPGDQLCISGITEGSGHRIMNAASCSFSIPTPISANACSPHAARVKNHVTPTLLAQDLPLDISVKLPPDALDETVWVNNARMRVGDIMEGEITTRLESEYKGAVTEERLHSMVDHAYQLTGLSRKALEGDADARAQLDKELGKDLVLTPVTRHWLDADGITLGAGGDALRVQRDENGWPRVDPMRDQYSDDDAMTFTRRSGALRVRSNAQKQGHAEFKLDGGQVDPTTSIRQRVELGISLKPGITEQHLTEMLARLNANRSLRIFWTPLGHLVREADKLGVTRALTENRTPWAEVNQVRHKFELKNTRTGTAVELSLDRVHAQTLRPQQADDTGQPRQATFCMVETELDHLQINSAHTTEMQGTTSRAALMTDGMQRTFVDDARASVAAGTAEFEIMREPQLHSLQHITDGTFRHTDSYKQFERMNQAILNALCGEELPEPAHQKSAYFAKRVGLVRE